MMAAQNDFDKAQEALDAGENFFYQGRSYTPAQIATQLLGQDGLITAALKAEREKKKAGETATTQEKNLDKRADKARRNALIAAKEELDLLENNKNFYLRGLNSGEISEDEFNAYTARVGQVKRDINAMEAGAPAQLVGSTTGYGRYRMLETGLSAPSPSFSPDRPETQRFEQFYRENLPLTTPLRIDGTVVPTPDVDTGGGGTTVSAGGVGAVKPARVTKADVDDALVQTGMTDTPENRKFVRDQLKQGVKLNRNWETLIEQQAGEYAYLMQGAFGQDVTDLLRRAVSQQWFNSEEGKKEFLDQFRRTEYYKNTTQKQQLFDKKTTADKAAAVQAEVDRIRSQFGEIQFDEMALNELAQTAARNGSTETELGRLVYRKAFQRGQVTPAATASAETAIRSQDADRIRAIYRAFGSRPNDDEIRRILTQEADPATGTVMTEDMLRNQLRDTAKVTYGQFADMIDRGISVEKIFAPYQQVAAGVLERTPDEISLVGENGVPTMYSEALMGEKPMSLTEWVKKLKVDPKYGYQFTNEAKQQVTKLVVDLEKAFGYRA